MNRVVITSLSDPRVCAYSGLTGAQLERADGGLFIAESVKVAAAAFKAGYEPVSFLSEEGNLRDIEAEFGDSLGYVPVYTADSALISSLTGYRLHRGVLAVFRRRPLPSVSVVLEGASRVAVLENVTDPTNVGAIFRSAAALGMDAVLVSSSSCDPLYRRSARVSMGSVFKIPWTVLPSMPDNRNRADLSLLRCEGFSILALALESDSVPPDSPVLKSLEKAEIVLGSEGSGLSPETVAFSDYTVMIPMKNGVDSLNVAAASAVAFWALSER